MTKIDILFLAANPNTGKQGLALPREYREVEEKIRASEHRDVLNVIFKGAVRPEDLLQSLNQYKPHVVHFSGHGNTDVLVFEDDSGQQKLVKKEALGAVFEACADKIRVVVLNACFSMSHAKAISLHIDCVIGMGDEITDAAATVFSAAFYGAIGFGRSVQQAFNQGIVALKLEGIDEDKTPQLFFKNSVDPNKVILVNPR